MCRVMTSLMFLDMILDNGYQWQGRLLVLNIWFVVFCMFVPFQLSMWACFMCSISQHEMETTLEPFIRRVVRFVYALEVEAYISVLATSFWSLSFIICKLFI